jgi:hypothetical protein
VIDLALPSRLTRPFGYDHVQVVVDADAEHLRPGHGNVGGIRFRAWRIGRLGVELSAWRRT